MFFENIKEAIISILSNKMRSLLTMLGIIIGISSVIIITTIGGSIQSTLTATMNSLGGNMNIRRANQKGKDKIYTCSRYNKFGVKHCSHAEGVKSA